MEKFNLFRKAKNAELSGISCTCLLAIPGRQRLKFSFKIIVCWLGTWLLNRVAFLRCCLRIRMLYSSEFHLLSVLLLPSYMLVYVLYCVWFCLYPWFYFIGVPNRSKQYFVCFWFSNMTLFKKLIGWGRELKSSRKSCFAFTLLVNFVVLSNSLL